MSQMSLVFIRYILPFLRWICFRTICYYNIRARKKIHKKHKMPRRTDAERAPGQKKSAGCGTDALGRVGGGAKTETLALLLFQFLLLYNVRLHFRLSPAVEVGLILEIL